MEVGVGRLDQLPLRWRWPEDKEMHSRGGGRTSRSVATQVEVA